ncbi:YadA-like family protein [Luteimonas sp. A277]
MNNIGVGVGSQGGEQALAIGYRRAIGNRASVSLGGALAGSEKSVSAGAGFSW